jgi:hypothetical protein
LAGFAAIRSVPGLEPALQPSYVRLPQKSKSIWRQP